MELRDAAEIKDIKPELNNKKIKEKQIRIFITAGTIFAMLITGIISYTYFTNSINERYDKVIQVVIGRDGTSFESLSKAFIPDLNTDKGIDMIMRTNGFSSDVELKRGDVVKIPTRGIENPMLAKPFIIKTVSEGD